MKNLYIIILVFISIRLFSQFSVSTELKYLMIINKQADVELVYDNILNAELASDSLIILGNNTELSAQFFNELATSYFITKKYSLSLFSLLRQRCLFPNKKIEQQQKDFLLETAYRCNLSDSVSQLLVNKSSFNNKKANYSSKLILLLELSTKIHKKELNNYIYRIGLTLRQQQQDIPIWYQHWEFLTLVNLKEKKKAQALKYGTNSKPIYSQITNNKLKYKVYRKTIKHYIKTNSFRQAHKILDEYNTCKLPVFLKFDSFVKGLRIWVRI